jgi:hypothetical protein
MENKYNTAESRRGFGMRSGNRNSQVYIGAFIIIAGVLLLLRRMGLPIPNWVTSWEMILIGIGIVMGFKSGFRDLSWVIPIIIGTIFLSNDIFPDLRFGRMVWPLGLIAIGLVILTKGSRNRFTNDFPPFNGGNSPGKDDYVSGFKKIAEPVVADSPSLPGEPAASNSTAGGFSSTNDEIECTAIFGGVKRTVVSKNFKGGEVVAVFGGAEIDLTHADIQGVVKLEATNILGGTKLIVPPTWDVQSEMVAIFGGVEDKRRIQPELINRNKRLVLMGTAFLGGLEIKSF